MNGNAPDPHLPIAAALCFSSYVDDPDQQTNGRYNIETMVQSFYPTYKVVWSAQQTSDYNYAYVVQTPDNEFYLAIRGSLPFDENGKPVISWGVFYNWFVEDFNVFGQHPWPYNLGGGAPSVAAGAWDAFSQLQGAVDVMGSNTDAYTYLKQNAVANGYPVYITGHSLGGNMADTYASYFASALAEDGLSYGNTHLFSFAAPAAGCADFVSDLQAKFPPGRSYHYEIDNDIIPKFPVVNTIALTVANMYNHSPQAAAISFSFDGVSGSLKDVIEALAGAIAFDLIVKGLSPYVQTPVTSAAFALSPSYLGDDFTDWFSQAAYQHSASHYVQILSGTTGGDVTGRMAQASTRMTKSSSAYEPA